MAHTTMASTGAKTWQAIKPVHDGGAWYRSVNVTENLPMASRIPTGGFYNGFGAILSHSYAQQFVTTPKESTMPGYWQGGGSAGGTQYGQSTRCNGYQGFGDIADDISQLTTQYNAQVAAGQTSNASATLSALEALKKKAAAEKGGDDWMGVLTTALTAGTEIYRTTVEQQAETRARRRARAQGIPYTPPVSTQVQRPAPGGGGAPRTGMGTGTMIGIGVGAVALLGLAAWKMG